MANLRVFLTIFLTLFCIIYFIGEVNGLDNGVGRTPPMGWNSWNKFNCTIDEELIKQTADALIEYGLHDVGYEYINIDDCWAGGRDEQGFIQASSTSFPGGIKALADYVHSKGLLFGIYSDAGYRTCAGRLGSLGFEDVDAMTYAEWGIDYLKYDNCFNGSTPEQGRYEIMRDMLNATGRPIFYSICEWGVSQPYLWAEPVGNSWRTTSDIKLGWDSIIEILEEQRKITQYAGPGGWNDPDMLQVGNGDLTIDEQKSHFSLWAALKAPLLLGFDIRNPPIDALNIVNNTEIIAINQDPLGKSVNMAQRTKRFEIWTGELSDGHVALLFNKGKSTITINLNFTAHMNIQGEVSIRDLWEHEDKGVFNESYSSAVPRHGIVVLKLTGGTKMNDYYDFIDQYGEESLRGFTLNYSIFVLIFIIFIFQYYLRYFCK